MYEDDEVGTHDRGLVRGAGGGTSVVFSPATMTRRARAMDAAVTQSSRLASLRRSLGNEKVLMRRSLRRTRRSAAAVRATRDELVAELTMPRSSRSSAAARDVWRVHVAYARRRAPDDLETLVLEYLPRADREARTMTHRPADIEDRMQVAREALVLALQRFDPSRRIPFEVFLDATVGGQLRKDVRDSGWLVRAPRRVHELYPAIRSATDRLSQELGHTPTPDEIGADLGVDVDDVLVALTTHHARTHRSLDAILRETNPSFDVGEAPKRMRRVEDVDVLRRALAVLNDVDRRLVHDYFILGLTQQQIADRLGRSQMHVSRQLRRVLRLLAARIDNVN